MRGSISARARARILETSGTTPSWSGSRLPGMAWSRASIGCSSRLSSARPKPSSRSDRVAGDSRMRSLARRAKRLIATDTSPTMVSLLRKRFEGRPSIEIRRVDGFRLGGLADQSIDAAFSYDVFIHLTHWHVYSYLEELHRVLRPGGRAIVHHANSFSPLGWQRFLRDLSRAREHQPAQAQFCPMTPELMRGLAERAGLTVEDSNTTVVRRDCITLLSRPA